MMRTRGLSLFTAFVAACAVVVSLSAFTIDARERAIVLQLGNPVTGVVGPGLHFRIPLIQTVRRFDVRILSVDPPPEQIVISSSDPAAAQTPDNTVSSGEPIIVDTFARYRISDPLKFLQSLGSVEAAAPRIESIMNDATRSVLGRSTLKQLLSKDRDGLMQAIRVQVNRKTEQDNLGIAVIDIRIVRADLTPELRQSTVTRMISQLKERATETRSNGEQRALEIRATADKERTILLANAQGQASALQGDGDRQAIALYAAAFDRDPNFYAFLRSLDAYRSSLAKPEQRLILSPDSAFFRVMREGPKP